MTDIETTFDFSVVKFWFVKYLSKLIMELNLEEKQWDELSLSAVGKLI
jgi:hypothetical protein